MLKQLLKGLRRFIIRMKIVGLVQQRLGHSDVNITLNTYTHVLPEMDVDAAAKLDQILLRKA